MCKKANPRLKKRRKNPKKIWESNFEHRNLISASPPDQCLVDLHLNNQRFPLMGVARFLFLGAPGSYTTLLIRRRTKYKKKIDSWLKNHFLENNQLE